jgi:hypothetical protein
MESVCIDVTRGGIGNVQNRNANLALYLLSIFVCSGAADDDKIRAASFKRLSSSDEYGHCVVPAILPFQGVDLREFDRVEQAASGMNATQPVRYGIKSQVPKTTNSGGWAKVGSKSRALTTTAQAIQMSLCAQATRATLLGLPRASSR